MGKTFHICRCAWNNGGTEWIYVTRTIYVAARISCLPPFFPMCPDPHVIFHLLELPFYARLELSLYITGSFDGPLFYLWDLFFLFLFLKTSFISLYLSLYIYISIYLSFYLSIFLFIFLFILCLTFCLSMYIHHPLIIIWNLFYYKLKEWI